MEESNHCEAAGPDRATFWGAVSLACLTLVLLVAGALVTSNEAGDSVPDWPMSFGRWLIDSNQFVANVRYEYSHRFLAGVVGLVTLGLAIWIQFIDRRARVRRLAWIAVAAVVVQALIGGIRVLLPEYKTFIAVPHALVAQSFFGLVVGLAVFASRDWIERSARSHEERCRDNRRPGARRLANLSVGAVLVQLVLGAGFRHQAFGIIPHIVGAVFVTVILIWTSRAVAGRYPNEKYLGYPALALVPLVIVQLTLGVAAYLARLASVNDVQPLEPMISLTVVHLTVGAITLATTIILALRCNATLSPERASSGRTESERAAIRSAARGATV